MIETRVDYLLYGGNAAGYNSREKEILLSGPAGTGKTLANLLKVHTLAGKFPKSRHLILRKTRSALTEAALVTYERDVLGETNPILTASPNERRVRQAYRYPNGSEVIVGGMDKPEKTLSTEYDTIYIQEFTELELEEYETLFRALRAGGVTIQGKPFTQIMSDCNPTFPHHWAYKRFTGGSLVNYATTHKDNPRYWDRIQECWTADGEQYLSTLRNLTGFRRKRFLEGIWAAAEGLVFDTFGLHNMLPRGWKPPKDWPRYHALDFGYVNPLAYLFFAKDHDGRLYLYREIYRTQMLIEDLAKIVAADLKAGNEPKPVAVVADHDAEDRATFERHSGLKITPAEKTRKKAGLQETAKRFEVAGDGKPRLFIAEGACERLDRRLSEAGKPTCFQEELAGYVWDADRDEPVKENDHASDATRYLCGYVDNKPVLTWGAR